MAPRSPVQWRPPIPLLALAGLLVLGIALAAGRHIRGLWHQERATVEHHLSTVGKLKASEIALWRQERLADAGTLSHIAAFTRLVGPAAGTRLPDSTVPLERWLSEQSQYDELRLLDTGGEERLVVPEGLPPLPESLKREAREALAEGRPRFLDLARDADGKGIHLHLLVPILDTLRPGRTLGLFVLRIDPARTLYPILLRWPTPSATADTLLVRREGEDAVVLNDMRTRAGTALTERVPMADRTRASVLAILGREGIVESLNYRGTRLLADVRPIPGSPWFLVARINEDEAMALFQRRRRDTVLLALASGLAVIAAAAAHWRNRRANYFRAQFAAERVRSEGESRFRHAVEEVPFPMMIYAEDGEILMVSRVFTELSGYAREDMPTLAAWAGQAFPDHGDEILETAKAHFDQPRRQGSREYPMRCRDGSTRVWDFSSVALGPLVDGRRTVMTMAHDITARKEAEAVVRRSEERFALIFHASPDAIAISRMADGLYLLVNERFAQLLGRPMGDVVGHTSFGISAWVDPRDRGRWMEVLDRDGRVDNLELDFRKADGATITCLVSSRIITWDGERVQISITRDISAHRALERALRESEAEYRMLFDRSLDAILLAAPDGAILDANPAACEMFGRTVEELRACGREGVIDLTDPRVPEAIEERRRTGRWTGELIFLRRDGTKFPCETSSVLFTDRFGQSRTSHILRDVSLRKEAEELQRKLDAEIQQSQKLDSLGSLAGGVAHDMNNILAAIQAVVETLRLTHAGDVPLVEALGLVEKASTRGRDLVLGLTKFSRKNLQQPELLDLNALVRDELDLLNRTTLQKYRLVADLQEGLLPVSGERGSLASILMNLCVNAVDAMPDGGTLVLRTRNLPGRRVEIAVEDDGTGMPPEVAARAMDPFFSTKAIGKGTGLGLAMAYAIAKAHGGTLAIATEKGRGTTVSLRLPAAAGEVAPAQGPADLPSAETPLEVLLVDDDDLIRAAVPSMLQARGHRVATAAGGAEGLVLLGSGPPVDLVILDLNMPGMNGIETHRHIRRRWPDLPILLATGHLDARTQELLETDGHMLALSKPYSLEELVGRIRDLLAGGSPPGQFR